MTALLDGKRVLGAPKEIQEVRNAFAAYDTLPDLQPAHINDLLETHKRLMLGLTEQAGCWRSGGVGIYRDDQLVHMPPPASQVPGLIGDLLTWLGTTDSHPLIASCIFHYEFEFIHPFTDGNGRLGRFWQTLILSQWRPALAFLPVETLIKEQQEQYYAVLREADKACDSTPFIGFMLKTIEQALTEALEVVGKEDAASDQVTDQATDQVKRLLEVLRSAKGQPLGAKELMELLQLKHRPTFRKNYLMPAIESGLVSMSFPDSPKSPKQSYRLSDRGLSMVKLFQ
ncbi:Fic family protein [Sansalvadorimonas verongulae]|uniref:Fic family protein n=1 Tax=Sansalvadorimonas verongulae TaxID=2172824 RepID=UPI002E3653E5|nr:Fic family protein [Sansalvadorimonas verongulae]